MSDESLPTESPTMFPRPLRYISDSFYLVLAAAGLMQIPRTVEVSGWVTGLCFAILIVGTAAFIGFSNKGRFISIFDTIDTDAKDSTT